ncbi:MAG: S9 family peptidase [Pyrinomonadaceae bacterium]|nr:S9 family peptidase [Pyrinomonadaceae bacterium]
MKNLSRIALALLLCAANLFAQGGVLTPGDNLVVEGVPPIPTQLVERINRYSEFRSAGLASWHPSRREMIISTRFADTAQAHLVKFPGGARTQLTFFPDTVGGASFQKRAGNYFIFSKAIGGNEFFQLYRYDFSNGEVTLLTDGKSRNTGGAWSNSGDLIAYGSTRRTGKDVDIYVMNPADPKTDRRLLTLEGGGWGAVDWSPDDKKLIVGEYVSANESYFWIVDTTTGEKTLFTTKGSEKVAYGGAQWSRDGKGIYVTTDLDSEFQRLAYVDVATKKYTYLTDDIKWDVDSFVLSPDGKTIAFVTNEDGNSRLYLLDTKTNRRRDVPNLLTGVIGGIQWHENSRDLGFTLSSARSTSDVYSIDASTGKIDRWTQSETGGLNTENFSEPELLRWSSFDNRSISGYLYRPPARFVGKRPVIINIHGGPEGQSRPGFLGRNNFLLNELGVAMIFPNIRGSSGYGKTFLKLDNGFQREDSYKDIGALLDWIKTRPDLDADRIMVTGGSYGGHMTLAVATRYSDRIRASVDIVGISNLRTFLENTEGYRRDLRRVEYGDERDPKMRAFMERIAPLNNAAQIKKPLFVVQGRNDPRVPYTEAEQIVRTVRAQNTPVWFLMAKDEGHGFAKKKNADYQFYATVLFIEQYVMK